MQKIYHILTRVLFFYYRRKWKRKKTKYEQNKPRLFWGTTPVLNFGIWSNIMRESGYESKSVINHIFSINKREDFDILIPELIPNKIRFNNKIVNRINNIFKRMQILDQFIDKYDIFFISYNGLNILQKKFWEAEILSLKNAGKKIVVLPYGSDWIQYSKFSVNSYKHGCMAHYPNTIKIEKEIGDRNLFLNNHADIIVGGNIIESKVWHVLSVNYLSIDIDKFKINRKENSKFTIVHSPNHRGIKGTEFLIKAVEELIEEGYLIDLVLLENVKNDEVIRILCEEANALVEQLFLGYGLSGIEGMAAGIPVLSNMEDDEINRQVLRRFSFLDECPILSATPEDIKEKLALLYNNRWLAKELGEAGRKYVEKYHSKKATNYLFESIISKIWYNKEVDLMNLYHPLMPNSYNNQSAKIEHPLIKNGLPKEYFNKPKELTPNHK